MDIERIKTTFERAGWTIVSAPENVTPAGSFFGQGPQGNGVLTIRGDGSGANVQLPMHRGMDALDVQRMVMYGRLLVATLPGTYNREGVKWYDQMIRLFARHPTNADDSRLLWMKYHAEMKWQPDQGKLIVEIMEQNT